MKSRDFIDEFDMYSSKVPGFNFEGREKIGSPIGCSVSTLVLILTFSFSTLKFTHMVTNRHPKISNGLEHGVFDSN